VSFTDLDQERDILSRFSLPKSMKHSVESTSEGKKKLKDDRKYVQKLRDKKCTIIQMSNW
jgi:hypothetical protein